MSRQARRAHRSRRRGRVIAGAVAVAVAVGIAAVVAFVVATGDGSDDEPTAVRTPVSAVASSTTTTPQAPVVASTEVAPPPPIVVAGPPYAVEAAQTTVVDPGRGTAARGPTAASGSRSLPVTVSVPAAPGTFPLVVFAHGYDIAAADYGDLQRELAAQGFVVVAPDFPLSSTAFPGPPTQADIDEQAREIVGFLVDTFLDGRVSGIWSGKVASGEAGVVGHSDGGNTVARAASNSCCFASRVGAAAVLAGDEETTGGAWGVAGAAPMLFVQGTADTINPWSFSQRLFDDAASPKTIVAIDGADHLAPYTTGPQRGDVVALVAAFLRGHLVGDATVRAQVATLAEAGDLRLVASLLTPASGRPPSRAPGASSLDPMSGFEVVERVEAESGWGVLHLFYAVDAERAAAEPGSAKLAVDAIAAFTDDEHQVLTFTVLGHKADLGIMALGPDLARLQQLQHALGAAPLRATWSYVSLTEGSEYTSTEDDERARLAAEEGVEEPAEVEARLAVWRDRMAHYRENRVHPRLPARKTICFYPMSKRREGDDNWYSLSFAERKRLMGGHARVGRGYAGRVLQLITGSTGLDDWEWGVTLLADDPGALKEIVYEMRFDEVSARYAEFGPFVTGLVHEPAETLRRVGLTV